MAFCLKKMSKNLQTTIRDAKLPSIHSDFILPILQRNTSYFPIQKRPVFSQFWRFFSQFEDFIGIYSQIQKAHAVSKKNHWYITVNLAISKSSQGPQIRVLNWKLFSYFSTKTCCGYSKEPSQWDSACLFCGFTYQSTDMVMGGRSVHLTNVFFLGKLEQVLNR